MSRIVAGTFKGRRIATPAGQATRPTSDRVREALFGALGDLTGTRFADLYAGSGAVGLEAASRGAAHVLLVENDPRAGRVIRDNIALLRAGDVVKLAPSRVDSVLLGGPGTGGRYDVVFADPPYESAEDEVAAVLGDLVAHGWLAADALVVVERSTRSPEPGWVKGITGERSRRYGETMLWYGRAS
ncbi:MAG: 16S rRNA (guanine(966)-N(2))-methyltransferase RsmD [Actinobacteria bacterium]|nr:MAG: 16S rRNA (guanine(966)-N(2))-methyltransferase RsmD [Actinomycetota bacterium]